MRLVIERSAFAPAFLPLLDDDEHDVILLLGGGGSGKSYFSYERAVIRCLQDSRKYLVLRNSATDLRRSSWEDVRSILSRFGVAANVQTNSTFLTIDYPNGSKMLFMGLDDPDKIKSIPDVTDIVVEEASEITLDKFSQCKQRLRGSGVLRNQIVLMTNPVSKANWVYRHFFERGCREPNCLVHRSTYRDNPFLNQSTIDALEAYRDTNPYYYRVYALGEWGSLSKQVFTNYAQEELDLEALRAKGLPHLVGLDFGFVNDPTALVDCLLDEEGKTLYVLRELYRPGLTNPEIAAAIKAMGLSKSAIAADSAEQKSIEEIRRCGVPRIKPASKGKGSVLQGIQRLQQFRIAVDPSCPNLLEELENYSWKKDRATGEYVNEPIDAYNHAIDALRYSLQCLDSRHQLKTLPRYTL